MANFSQLPKELVLMVAECLPPHNLLALSQTCNGLRTMLDVHIEAVLPKTVANIAADELTYTYYWRAREMYSIDVDSEIDHGPGPRGGLSEEDSQRLEFLLMLERDGQLSEQRLICSGCVQTHERSLFLSQTRQRQPTKRYCIGWEGRVQICPHQALSYVNVTERLPILKCGSCGRERHYWFIEYSGGRLVIHLRRSLTLGVPLDMVRWPDVMKVLKSRCIAFCPHTHSSDEDFLDRIHYHYDHAGICVDCPAYDQPDGSGSCYVGHHNCVTCGMWVKISTAKRDLQDLEEIQISVLRDLGPPSTKPTEPQWIANVTRPLTKKVTIPSILNSEP